MVEKDVDKNQKRNKEILSSLVRGRDIFHIVR